MKTWTACARRDGERGNVALEMALVLPVLALITFGVVDFARLFYSYMTVASAAHEAAAYAALHRSDLDYIGLSSTAKEDKLKNVAADESGGYLVFSGTNKNTDLYQPTPVSGTGTAAMQKVELRYSFKPLVALPRKGPIPVTAVAAAR